MNDNGGKRPFMTEAEFGKSVRKQRKILLMAGICGAFFALGFFVVSMVVLSIFGHTMMRVHRMHRNAVVSGTHSGVWERQENYRRFERPTRRNSRRHFFSEQATSESFALAPIIIEPPEGLWITLDEIDFVLGDVDSVLSSIFSRQLDWSGIGRDLSEFFDETPAEPTVERFALEDVRSLTINSTQSSVVLLAHEDEDLKIASDGGFDFVLKDGHLSITALTSDVGIVIPNANRNAIFENLVVNGRQSTVSLRAQNPHRVIATNIEVVGAQNSINLMNLEVPGLLNLDSPQSAIVLNDVLAEDSVINNPLGNTWVY